MADARSAFRAALRVARQFPNERYRPKMREMVRELFEVRREETNAAPLIARARRVTAAVRVFGFADRALIAKLLEHVKGKAK